VSIFGRPVRLIGDCPQDEEHAMKYMLLIHQGTAPTPRSPEEWATLSDDERTPSTPTTRRSTRPPA